MRYHLFIGGEVTVREFDMRLNRMNDYLQYFPTIETATGNLNQCQVLGDDQLCDIINLAKKPEWTLKMMEANVDPYDLDLHDLLDYLERLELVNSLLQKSKQENQQENQRERQQEHPVFNKYKPDESTSSERKPKKPRTQCPICSKYHPGQCWFKDNNNKEGNSHGQKNHNNNSTQPLQPHTFSIEEVCTMMNAFQGNSKNPKSGKRKISSRGDDSAKQACSMLRSMSLREPHTTST